MYVQRCAYVDILVQPDTPMFKKRAVLLDYLQEDPQTFALSASLQISPLLEPPEDPSISPLSAER